MFNVAQEQITKLCQAQHAQTIGMSTAALLNQRTINKCLQPLYMHNMTHRIRVSVRLPSNDRYLMMFDKSLFKTCPAFIDLIVDKFSLDTTQYRHPQGFFVKE